MDQDETIASDDTMGAHGQGRSPGPGEPSLGAIVAGYRLEEVIGRGGMGVVFRAVDLALKRRVAVKIIAPALARDTRFRAMFVEEARRAASLEHPNIVPVYRSGESGRHLYIAMRFVDGDSLAARVRRDGPLEPRDAVEVVLQIAQALREAHAAGLLHRDVKPGNILIQGAAGAMRASLADFGLATAIDAQPDRTGPVTPRFASPEQLRAAPLDGRADLYSLGRVLQFAVTGRPPAGPDGVAAAGRDSGELPSVPRFLRGVIRTATAHDVADRFQSADEMIDALDTVSSGLSRGTLGRMVATGAVAVGLAAVVGASLIAAAGRREAVVARASQAAALTDHAAGRAVNPQQAVVMARQAWDLSNDPEVAAGLRAGVDRSRLRQTLDLPMIAWAPLPDGNLAVLRRTRADVSQSELVVIDMTSGRRRARAADALGGSAWTMGSWGGGVAAVSRDSQAVVTFEPPDWRPIERARLGRVGVGTVLSDPVERNAIVVSSLSSGDAWSVDTTSGAVRSLARANQGTVFGRDAEGSYWAAQVDDPSRVRATGGRRPGRTVTGDGPISWATLDADGSRMIVVTASSVDLYSVDGEPRRLGRIRDGDLAAPGSDPPGRSGDALGAAFAPAGDRFMVWSDAGTVWEFATDPVRQIGSLATGTGIESATYLATGDLITFGDGRVTRWAGSTRTPTRRAPGAVAVSGNGTHSVAVVPSRWVILRDEYGTDVARWPVRDGVSAAAVSDDGARVVAALDDGRIVRFTPGSRGPTVIASLRAGVTSLAVSPQGDRMLIATTDGTLTEAGRSADVEAVETGSATAAVTAMAWSADGGTVAVAAGDGTLTAREATMTRPPAVIGRLRRPIRAVALSPDGAFAIVATGEDLSIWDVARRERLIVRDGNVRSVSAGAGGWFGAVLDDGTTERWRCDACGPIGDVARLARERTATSSTE